MDDTNGTVTEKIRLFNSLKKSDYVKGNTVPYKLKTELIEDIDVPIEDIENIFISEEQYEALPE